MAEKRSDKITIIEVARRAGVSTATAGRVLGGYGYASEEIKEKVRAVAEELGYRPNLLARGLITGKTQTIGVVAGDIESPFYASILRGIADVARNKGFGVIVTDSDEVFQRERDAVQLLMEKQVDGIIVAPCDLESSRHLHDALDAHCPVVQIDRFVQGLRADSVTLDNRGAAREAVQILLRGGHRRIGIVAELEQSPFGDLRTFIGMSSFSSVERGTLFPSWQRLLGYLEAHAEAGVPVDERLVRRVGAYSSAAAREETLDLLRAGNAPTALFTADGLMSAGVMGAISTLGIELPRELSLICFDDLDWMSFLRPSITAIAQPLNEMGRAAARLILARIGGDDTPIEQLVLAPRIRMRDSVTSLLSQPAA